MRAELGKWRETYKKAVTSSRVENVLFQLYNKQPAAYLNVFNKFAADFSSKSSPCPGFINIICEKSRVLVGFDIRLLRELDFLSFH